MKMREWKKENNNILLDFEIIIYTSKYQKQNNLNINYFCIFFILSTIERHRPNTVCHEILESHEIKNTTSQKSKKVEKNLRNNVSTETFFEVLSLVIQNSLRAILDLCRSIAQTILINQIRVCNINFIND